MALTQLALMYARGTGVEQSSTRAFELFAEAAAQGWSQAMYNAGQCCLVGRGVDKNTERGIDLIRRAAELGNVDGLRYLAFTHAEGDETLAKDLTSAAKSWLSRATKTGWTIADQLGDDERALRCLERRLQWYLPLRAGSCSAESMLGAGRLKKPLTCSNAALRFPVTTSSGSWVGCTFATLEQRRENKPAS